MGDQLHEWFVLNKNRFIRPLNGEFIDAEAMLRAWDADPENPLRKSLVEAEKFRDGDKFAGWIRRKISTCCPARDE